MTTIRENTLIEQLVREMPRSSKQIGGLQQSDAELIRLPGSDTILAVTTDSIAEEIEIGLYRDPHLIGWMAVVVNASDLAAVGAEPFGILLNETLPHNYSPENRSRLQEGIRDACVACNLPVFGGDTNASSHLQVGATALGLVRSGQPMTRIGCRPGDWLFASDQLGMGSVHAIAAFQGLNGHAGSVPAYMPAPRLKEGQLLRPYASACMDTSDGALAALDQLSRLNDVGFDLTLTEAIHPAANALAAELGIPAWMMLAGLHGEFELLFTIPQEAADPFVHHAGSVGWQPRPIGRVVDQAGVRVDDRGERILLDTGSIRNLFDEPSPDIRTIILQLKSMEEPCTQ